MKTMQRISTDHIFETSDLYLAAYLLTQGLEFWATDGRDPARVVFVLTPRPRPEYLEAYAEGRANANIGEFGRSLRRLKRALWRAKEGR
jgi:hypothetical protein